MRWRQGTETRGCTFRLFSSKLWRPFRWRTVAVAFYPNKDFYNVRKVDTHIHHSAAARLGKFSFLNRAASNRAVNGSRLLLGHECQALVAVHEKEAEEILLRRGRCHLVDTLLWNWSLLSASNAGLTPLSCITSRLASSTSEVKDGKERTLKTVFGETRFI